MDLEGWAHVDPLLNQVVQTRTSSHGLKEHGEQKIDNEVSYLPDSFTRIMGD